MLRRVVGAFAVRLTLVSLSTQSLAGDPAAAYRCGRAEATASVLRWGSRTRITCVLSGDSRTK
jgi:hypothetical protein